MPAVLANETGFVQSLGRILLPSTPDEKCLIPNLTWVFGSLQSYVDIREDELFMLYTINLLMYRV